MPSQLKIEILGTSFSVRADEDKAYLDRILWYLEKRIDETKKTVPVADPTTIAILTSFHLIDELLKEKSGSGKGMNSEDDEKVDNLVLRLISDINTAIQD